MGEVFPWEHEVECASVIGGGPGQPGPGESSKARLAAITIFITIQKKNLGSNRVRVTGREYISSAGVAAMNRQSYASVSGIRSQGSLL
jgi:hypothetical protein